MGREVSCRDETDKEFPGLGAALFSFCFSFQINLQHVLETAESEPHVLVLTPSL